ncbi:hypothetical protein ACH5RR_008720 [Cinchona calisaya]|uniref:GRAM domain-containing protein n=1 Tax=Cinchona calisaya TaxID=153742 RepID=A0ABD3AHN1_9GENT
MEELDDLLEKKDTMWKQRGKAQWYKEGDRNMAFFLAKSLERRHRNWISGLKDDTGCWRKEPKEEAGRYGVFKGIAIGKNKPQEVKQMMLRDGRKEVVWVRREGNKAAHQLARHAKVIDDAMTWQGKGLSFLEDDHFSEMSSFGTTTPESERSCSCSEPSCQCPSSSDDFPTLGSNDKGVDSMVVLKKGEKLERNSNSYIQRIREHVKMGPEFSETVKGKLSVAAKIILKRGRENIFKHEFSISDGEQLLKASQCYLSTTPDPFIAGILFISTEKVVFCSERPVNLHSSSGCVTKTPYKVSIPVRKIIRANEKENLETPANKCIEIVTEDNCKFCLKGFVRYEKAFMNLQKAISVSKSRPFT